VDASLVVQTEGAVSIALDNHGLGAALQAFEHSPDSWHPMMVFHAYLNPRCETDVRYVATAAEVAAAEAPVASRRVLTVGPYEGERAALRPLMRLADDSEDEIDRYIDAGVAFAVHEGEEVVAYLLLTATAEPHVCEIKSMAVVERLQGGGLGRVLVEKVVEHCRRMRAQASPGSRADVRTLVVATAAAGLGQLRFYQRLGFRMLRIEREAFGAHNGYPEGIVLNGIPLRDRVWLSMEVPEEPAAPAEREEPEEPSSSEAEPLAARAAGRNEA
jgi:GNAT superfamily N-acetyltransferase